ncbi:hypothetical protein, partial [Aeromonas sp. 601126]|uniref:hypothetical protein n=1 Tax=unclassified Aeromonas TaxID=257493 RepID=UPI003BA316D3
MVETTSYGLEKAQETALIAIGCIPDGYIFNVMRGKRRKLSGSWLRGPDLNRRPSGYEPDELPSCST